MSYEITLNGANYASEARKRAYEESLARHNPTMAAPDESDRRRGEMVADLASATAVAVASPRAVEALAPTHTGSMAPTHVLESLERGLAQSYDHQSETLRVHQHYLSNEAAYAGIFAQLMQEQGALFAGAGGAPAQSDLVLTVLRTLGQSIEQFHDHQSQTLTVHSQFLEQQAVYAQSFVDLLQRHYGAVLQGNAAGSGHVPGNGHGGDGRGDGHGNGNGNGDGHIGAAVHGNGHEPQAPMASYAGPDAAASRMALGAPQSTATTGPAVKARLIPVPVVAAASTASPAQDVITAPSTEALVVSLLSIVSEKTGYPAEMLDLDMDMEADLGIDSIKRVEILGALEEAHPDLPALAPEVLVELRTLAQVIATSSAGSGVPAGAQALPERGPSSPVIPALQAIPGLATPDTSRMVHDLLAIVSEKTGYPAEMLDLSMDMEADLGIDSIKRVEILGSFQELHPGLGAIEPEALVEVHTLAGILDHVATSAGTSSAMEAVAPKKA